MNAPSQSINNRPNTIRACKYQVKPAARLPRKRQKHISRKRDENRGEYTKEKINIQAISLIKIVINNFLYQKLLTLNSFPEVFSPGVHIAHESALFAPTRTPFNGAP